MFARLDLAKMIGVKVCQFTVERLPMSVWTKWALDGWWLERRDGSKCAQCPAQDISVWALPVSLPALSVSAPSKSSSPPQTRDFYCASCWLREMLHQHGAGGTATECKKGGAVDVGIELRMAELRLEATGRGNKRMLENAV